MSMPAAQRRKKEGKKRVETFRDGDFFFKDTGGLSCVLPPSGVGLAVLPLAWFGVVDCE